MITSRSILVRTTTVLEKNCWESQRHILCSTTFFPKIVPLWNYVEKHCNAGNATDYNMVHVHCMLDKQRCRHTLVICNTCYFPLQQWLHEHASVFRFYVHHLSCWKWTHYMSTTHIWGTFQSFSEYPHYLRKLLNMPHKIFLPPNLTFLKYIHTHIHIQTYIQKYMYKYIRSHHKTTNVLKSMCNFSSSVYFWGSNISVIYASGSN